MTWEALEGAGACLLTPEGRSRATLLEIAEHAGLPFAAIHHAASLLAAHDLPAEVHDFDNDRQ